MCILSTHKKVLILNILNFNEIGEPHDHERGVLVKEKRSRNKLFYKSVGRQLCSIYLADWHEKWQISLLIICMRAWSHDVLHIIAPIRCVAHDKTKKNKLLNKITRKHHNIRQVCYKKQISVFEFLEIIETLTFCFDWLVRNCVIAMKWLVFSYTSWQFIVWHDIVVR